MKSKKAQARRAAEQAEAQAKLDLVEGYKQHYRELLGMTIDDMAVESLTAPASDPLRGLSWPEAVQMRTLPAQHDHIYQSPREWANSVAARAPVSGRMEALLERSRRPASFAQLLAQTFATRPTAAMMAAMTGMLTTNTTITGRATSQREPEAHALPPARPTTRDEWNELLTSGLNERLRLTETPLGRMTLETFEDMTIHGVSTCRLLEDGEE